jgi:transcriptional regulator with XRE-family HTH domain
MASFDPGQVRAARALLGWSQEELASKAGMSPRTILQLEKGEGSSAVMNQVAGFLSTQGILFRVEEEGLLLTVQLRRKPTPPLVSGTG